MLIIKDVFKSFGEQRILCGLNLTVESGKIYTLIGGNGSGKTTLFNIITGFIRSDSGDISFKDKRINNCSPVFINKLGISRTFQDLRLITQLTVKENILLSFKNNPGERIYNAFLPECIFKERYKVFSEKADNVIETIHLVDVRNNLAGEISFGQQKLLTIGCCIANDSSLMLLDEPIAGIDKGNYSRLCELISNLKKEGKTILQIEHNSHYVESLSDAIWYLNNGIAVQFDTYQSFVNYNTAKTSNIN